MHELIKIALLFTSSLALGVIITSLYFMGKKWSISASDSSKIQGFINRTKPELRQWYSDGYHCFKELYDFRMYYNAALFNEWATSGKYDVHKSWKHNDGADCFGGGWFIVVAILPDGQITNHYEGKYWKLFSIPEIDKAKYEFDGHTSSDVVDRISKLLIYKYKKMAQATTGTATQRTQTFGEKLAGVGLNPSGDVLADLIKQSHADLMDHLEQERQDASDRGETLKAELLSAAIQAQLNAKLLSVNAILFS